MSVFNVIIRRIVMILMLNDDEMKELDEYIECFSGAYFDDKAVDCFLDIKSIIESKTEIESIDYATAWNIVLQLKQIENFFNSIFHSGFEKSEFITRLINIFSENRDFSGEMILERSDIVFDLKKCFEEK